MNKVKKSNIVSFPTNLTEGEREVEAILFAAAEPLDVVTIESKISKKINILKILKKQKHSEIKFYLFVGAQNGLRYSPL